MNETIPINQLEKSEIVQARAFLAELEAWQELQIIKTEASTDEQEELVINFEAYFLSKVMPVVIVELIYQKGDLDPLEPQLDLNSPEIYPQLKQEIKKRLTAELRSGLNEITEKFSKE